MRYVLDMIKAFAIVLAALIAILPVAYLFAELACFLSTSCIG